ncbi:hypothetical protein QBC38DRAFT_247819 [Podospora fimiseda]|uniref:Uncharacterized protein n=1 Tax=Podospora fimiseda TaxID=252190 RepID=A0AAN7BXQ2_9PEZI|nr:hypothetical protein QBC38DRAFT_247819 [Podospora fimiseda]
MTDEETDDVPGEEIKTFGMGVSDLTCHPWTPGWDPHILHALPRDLTCFFLQHHPLARARTIGRYLSHGFLRLKFSHALHLRMGAEMAGQTVNILFSCFLLHRHILRFNYHREEGSNRLHKPIRGLASSLLTTGVARPRTPRNAGPVLRACLGSLARFLGSWLAAVTSSNGKEFAAPLQDRAPLLDDISQHQQIWGGFFFYILFYTFFLLVPSDLFAVVSSAAIQRIHCHGAVVDQDEQGGLLRPCVQGIPPES